jgi:branched-chain amino acid transport system ATP-binding protein
VSALLALDAVTKRFGGLLAVSAVTAAIEEGSITGIIGPNGAGKTTLFSMIAGGQAPTSGRILFRGRDVTRVSADRACRLGIARTFQVVRPFWALSVADHLRAALVFGSPHGPDEGRVRELLALTGLTAQAAAPARTLTLAACRRLEIARALATDPALLLLDETMAGLNAEETREAIALVRRVRDGGRTVILIEHVLPAVTDLCDRALVLDHGEVIAEGPPRAILADPAVRRAYLGETD